MGYCRDSGGEEQDRSVAQQIEAITEYCEHNGLILEHIYSDEAKLSSNTDKRGALQNMLNDLRQRFKRINDKYKRQQAVVNQWKTSLMPLKKWVLRPISNNAMKSAKKKRKSC